MSPQPPIRDEKFWDERYERHDAPWDTNRPSNQLQRIIGEYNILPCRVLEFGCGTGANAVFLAQQGFDVTALDISPLAVEQARAKVQAAGVNVKLLAADVLKLPDLGPPFPFAFDRGVYHGIRQENLGGFLDVLKRVVAPGGMYLTMAGNANEVSPPEIGPPRVSAEEICCELGSIMDLVQLREFRFGELIIDDRRAHPLAWSALFRGK